jgi:hypothetical protein
MIIPQTLIQKGQEDPIFAAFYGVIASGVVEMEARHDVLVLIEKLEDQLETAHTCLAVVARQLCDYHKGHACFDGCIICDALEAAEIVLKGTGAQLP